MRYEIPQFIDIEDKIFGPLTFKQFIYLLGGGAICYICYTLLPFSVALFIIIPIGLLSAALAFYKHNTRPFIEVLQNFFSYLFKSKSYLWKRVPTKETISLSKNDSSRVSSQILYEPVNLDRRITDLSKNLDLLDRTQ